MKSLLLVLFSTYTRRKLHFVYFCLD